MHSWINPSKVLFTYNLVSNFIYYPNWILKLRYFFNTLSNLQQSKRIYSNYVTISNLQSKTTKYGKLITDQPKTILLGIYDIVSKHLGSKKFTPSFKCLPLKDNPQKWKAEVTLHWPSTIIEEGIATRKRTAEAIAATKAIEWLHENNFLDKNNYPILYQKDEKEKLIQKWKSPYFINITSEVEEKMKCLLNEYETVRKIIENWENELSSHSLFIKDSEDSSNNSSVEVASLKLPFLLETSHNLIDIITGEKFKDYEPEQLLSRSFEMQLEMRAKENNIEYLRMKNLRAHHPISEKRDEILSLIRNNQVIVLSGETGCGKTTQVPQYILEQYTELYEGANCNIVVTQPRRISAISIASRIAEERCEKIGDTVGFQVRLNKQLPSKKGAILFCTTGILLRKLQLNPVLKGISHVIIDEVHERSVQTDFLLILLKKILKENKDLKVILMSATVNSKLFSEYFNYCPIINIPGFTFPVKEYFLNDILDLIGKKYMKIEEGPEINVDLIIEVIKVIDKTRPAGAILCFLPGWHEIKIIKNKLKNIFSDNQQYQIHCLHSLVPYNQQSEVFDIAPLNVRKIILATNIAETSLTINDVVYVIDPGCHRELRYNHSNNLSILATQWISKANIHQRKGRAGRVQPGECFHLFTREVMNDMMEFPIPEMLRVSLENLIVDSKIYCPNISAIEFLSEALQAPNIESIKYSIRDLQQLDILNENENLTILGKHVACFTTHPRLSKAIIFSSILRCVDPVLTIAAMLTSRNPFDVKLDDNTTIREIKKKYDKDYSSDHLTFVNMYDAWNSIETHEESVEFCELNKINIHNMNFIKGLKTILVEHLCQTGLMKSVTTQDENIYANQYSSNPALILSTLCTGFFPKILKQQTGTLDRGRINWKEISLSTIQGKKARIASTSVLHKKNNLTSPWLIYFSGLQAEERGRLTIRDASVIPGIALIMCAGKQVKMLHQSNENKTAFLTIDDNPKLLFALSSKQGQYLIELRHCFNNLIQWLLCNSDDTSNNEKVKTFINHFLDVFNQLLLQEQQYTKIDQT